MSSQADTERAALDRERNELAVDPVHEHAELTAIYVARGLDAELADHVATQLTAHDALGAHGRDELGITNTLSARPVQAAFASAGTFSIGALLPLLIVLVVPASALMGVRCGQLAGISRAVRFPLAARAGGAPVMTAAVRVTFWGSLTMTLTAGVGALFGVTA